MDDFDITRVLNHVELQVGGSTVDWLMGLMLPMLLKYYNLSYEINDKQVVVPIPFHILINNSVLFISQLEYHDVIIKLFMNDKNSFGNVESVKLSVSKLKYNKINVDYEHYNAFKQICRPFLWWNVDYQFIFKTNTINMVDNKNGTIKFTFEDLVDEMFFVFLDENNSIIRKNQFTFGTLKLDNYDYQFDNNLESNDGTFYLSLKNVNPEHNKVQLSKIQDQQLIFTNINKNVSKVIVWIHGYKIFGYVSGMGGYGLLKELS